MNNPGKLTRRLWLSQCAALAVMADFAAGRPLSFEALDAKTAPEIEALSEQIIPGAGEAGVIYFIDRALSTFDADKREQYRTGMAAVQTQRANLFPKSASIVGLTPIEQSKLMESIEKTEFFELLRTHTMFGYLGDPSYGGNRGRAGWKLIGFDDAMAFQPPFGYYDAER